MVQVKEKYTEFEKKVLAECKASIGTPRFKKISEEIKAVRVLRKEGYSIREMAEFLNLCPATISKRLKEAQIEDGKALPSAHNGSLNEPRSDRYYRLLKEERDNGSD